MEEGLFAKPKNRIIVTHDIYGNKHKRELKNFKFRASVYGVLLNNNKILFKRHPLIKKYELPGGGVELDEKINQALIREFKEETGLIVRVTNLIAVKDSFFTFQNQDAHGILIFYFVKKIGGRLQPNLTDSADVKYLSLKSRTSSNTHKSCWDIIKKLKIQSISELKKRLKS